MVANLIGLGTPSLSSPITGPVRTPSASRLIGPTLMKQAKQVFYCGERERETLSDGGREEREKLRQCVVERQ